MDHIATLFRMRGATRRPIRCAVFRTDTGFELRLEYEDRDHLLQSQLFKTRDEDGIATLADPMAHRAGRQGIRGADAGVTVRLYWTDGRVEQVDVTDDVEVIVREGKAGQRHFWRTEDRDAAGFVVFVEEFEEA